MHIRSFDASRQHSSARPFREGLVSIITPTLQAQRFLRETVDSVLGQTYRHIEYILIDSGSSDATLSIARSFDGRITVLSAPGSTQAEAINYGFRSANGEFFGFLNADDTLYPYAVELAVQALRASPESPFAYGDAVHVDSLGRPVGFYPTRSFSSEALRKDCFICQPATLIRSSAFSDVSGLDEELETAFDYDLWIRLTKSGKTPVRVQELWATSRMHLENKSLRLRSTVYSEAFEVLQRHYGYVPFNWIHAYAGYLVEGKDYFFAAPSGSPRRTLLTFWLGLRQNKRQWLRFVREYTTEIRRLLQTTMRKGNA